MLFQQCKVHCETFHINVIFIGTHSFLLFLFLLPDVATLPTGAPAVEYTLGRGNENDIWMGKQDKSLSRLHAKISVKPA